MARELHDRAICILGASSGIGRATALACAQAGMNVAVAARRRDPLQTLAAEIERAGRRPLVVECDVARDSDVNGAVRVSLDAFGRLDAVLANAGHGLEGCAADLSDEAVRRLFEVNFFGTLRAIRAAVPLFRAQRAGHLLITSSSLSRATLPFLGAYAATKAAQTQVARSLRVELAPEGIDVSVIHPITTVTEFFDVSAAASGRSRRGVPPGVPRFLIQSPERVARAIVRCLRRPVPEVWTSHLARLGSGLLIAFPKLQDAFLRRQLHQR